MRSVLVCGHVCVMKHAQGLIFPLFRWRAFTQHFFPSFGSSAIANGVTIRMKVPNMSTQTRSTLEVWLPFALCTLVPFFPLFFFFSSRMFLVFVIVVGNFSAVAYFACTFIRTLRFRAFELRLLLHFFICFLTGNGQVLPHVGCV